MQQPLQCPPSRKTQCNSPPALSCYFSLKLLNRFPFSHSPALILCALSLDSNASRFSTLEQRAREVYIRTLWNGQYLEYDSSTSGHHNSIMADMMAGESIGPLLLLSLPLSLIPLLSLPLLFILLSISYLFPPFCPPSSTSFPPLPCPTLNTLALALSSLTLNTIPYTVSGQWYARTCNLPPVVPREMALSCYQTIYRMNVLAFGGGKLLGQSVESCYHYHGCCFHGWEILELAVMKAITASEHLLLYNCNFCSLFLSPLLSSSLIPSSPISSNIRFHLLIASPLPPFLLVPPPPPPPAPPPPFC